jgi:hypothetical protein
MDIADMGMLELWTGAKMLEDTLRHDCIQDKLNAKSRLKELADKNSVVYWTLE